jgi:hypothetical protein
MTTANEALRQLTEVCKLVDFADCAERPELWHKLNAAQQVAEEVLRRPEQAQPAPTGDSEQDALLSSQVGKWRKEVARLNDLIATATGEQAVAAVPDGFALVPLIATDDMIVAFAEQWYSKRQAIDDPDMADAYKAMLAVAPQPAAAPSGDAWQPIETAPKDGTRILIGRAGYPWTFVAGWNPHRQHWAYGSDAMSYLPMATHWKPSPLAPTATKE